MSLIFVQQIFYWLCHFLSPKYIHFWKRHYSSRQAHWIKEYSYLRQWGLFPEYFLKLFSFDVSLDLALCYWSTLKEDARLWLTSSLQLTLMKMSRTKRNKYKRERKHCERSMLSGLKNRERKWIQNQTLQHLSVVLINFADKVIADNWRAKSAFDILDLLFWLSFDTYEKGVWITKKKKKEKKLQNDLYKCTLLMRTEE